MNRSRMQKYRSLFPVMLLAFALIFALAVCAAEKTVYLGASDAAEGDGSEAAPFNSLAKAIEAVQSGGRIVVTETYTVTERDAVTADIPRFLAPTHEGKITITSLDGKLDYRRGGACIYFPETYIYECGGDVRFENVTLKNDAAPIYLAGNFHALEFGEGFDVKNTKGVAKYLYVIGGYYAPRSKDFPADRDAHITIDNGNFARVIAFGMGKGAGTYTFTGTAHIHIRGGHIDRIYGGATLNHYAGSLDLQVRDGSIGDIYTSGDATRRTLGNATVGLYGGTMRTLYINNMLGSTEVTLDGIKLNGIQVTFGSEQIQNLAHGKPIRLRYNSLLYTADFVGAVEGITSAERFGVLYVSADGSGDGSRENPLGSLAEAVRQLADGGGDIVLVGDYTATNFTEPTHAQPIVYRGDSLLLSGTFTAGGDVTFDALTLGGSGTLACGAHKAVFADACVTDGTFALTGEDLTVSGGSFTSVRGSKLTWAGGAAKTVEPSGDASLVQSGGSIASLTLTGNSVAAELLGGSVETMVVKDVAGSFRLTLGGGSVSALTVTDCGQAVLVVLPAADAALVARLSPAFSEATTQTAAFVRDGGTGNGSSPENAAPTLADAYAMLPDGGTIVLCGKVSVTENTAMPTANKAYTLTSVYGGVDYRTSGAVLSLAGNVGFYAPTTLEKLSIRAEKSPIWISFNGNTAHIGRDVTCDLAPNATTYPSLVGGTRRSDFAISGANLTVESGSWHQVYGANTAAADFPNLQTTMTVTGGDFYSRVCAMGAGNQTGEGVLTVRGGNFYGGVYGLASLAAETFDGKIRINLAGGNFYGKIRVATRYETTVDGSFDLTVSGGDYAHVTDVVGGSRFRGNVASTLTAADDTLLTQAVSGSFTYQNPIRKTADPRIALVDGMYFYMFTSGSTLSMYKAANVADLAYAVGEQIFDARTASDAMETRTACIWPSELQYFSAEEFGAANAGWYLFFSTFSRELDGLPSTATDGQSRRSYVLKCTSNDLQGTWVNPITGEVGVPARFTSDTEDFVNTVDWCAGESTLRYGGKTYALWIEQRGRGTADFRQVMYLSEMKNPWTVTGKVLELVAPEYDWEREGYGYAEAEGKWYPAVIEGATPIVGDNGELHVLYACSGYWTTGYKLGQMTYLGGDLLAKESWKKSPQAVFSKNDEVCGVGGPSIFTSPNGKTRCILYHGYLGKDTSSGRYCFMEPYTVDADGVHIGKDGHPSQLTTTFTVPLNTMPLGAKVSGFDNLGMTRVKLKIGSHTGSVNETEAQLDAAPVIRNNRTMLPARFVAESFGAAVTWDGTTSTAKFVAKDGTVISIRIGAAEATVGGKAVALDTPAYIDAASGRTYLPVRFLAESLGALVVWNGEISTAYLIR